MKKWLAVLMALGMMVNLAACGDKKEDTKKEEKSQYESATEILDKVYQAYEESEKFEITGGNADNLVEGKAGKFDITKTEELDFYLGIPSDEVKNIEEVACMIHMLNANTFTSSAIRLKKDVDKNVFAEALKANILKKEWVCGIPETFVVIAVDNEYVISCYGNDQLVTTFKKHIEEQLKDSKVILEQGI